MFRFDHKQDVQLLIQGKMQGNLFVVPPRKLFFFCVNHSSQISSLLSASAEAFIALNCSLQAAKLQWTDEAENICTPESH